MRVPRVRFSVIGLMIAVAVLAITLAWIKRRVDPKLLEAARYEQQELQWTKDAQAYEAKEKNLVEGSLAWLKNRTYKESCQKQAAFNAQMKDFYRNLVFHPWERHSPPVPPPATTTPPWMITSPAPQ
jgi:hypothetical protein